MNEDKCGSTQPALVDILIYQQRLINEQSDLISAIQERVVNLRDMRSQSKLENSESEPQREGLMAQFDVNNTRINKNVNQLRDILTQMQQMF